MTSKISGITRRNILRVGLASLALPGTTIVNLACKPDQDKRASNTEGYPPDQSNMHDQNDDMGNTMKIQYLEIVTPDVDAACALYSQMYSVVFGKADQNLGGARTANPASGSYDFREVVPSQTNDRDEELDMIEILRKHPSKSANRIMLILGFAVFIPVYVYNIGLLKTMPFDMNEYASVISSFSAQSLRDLLQSVIQHGQLPTLRFVYILNIISTTALAVGLFALYTLIARKYKPGTRLSTISYWCPFAVLAIAFLDYLFSIVFLTTMGNSERIRDWHSFIICSTYVIRIVLLYFIFLWGIVAAGYFAVRAIKKKQAS